MSGRFSFDILRSPENPRILQLANKRVACIRFSRDAVGPMLSEGFLTVGHVRRILETKNKPDVIARILY